MGGTHREPRAIVLVLDSVGAGSLPDAAEYGDEGSNTLSHTSHAVGGISMPVLGAMGLGNVTDIQVFRRLTRRVRRGSQRRSLGGKDTTTGHWELMGLVLKQAFPTYPTASLTTSWTNSSVSPACRGIWVTTR